MNTPDCGPPLAAAPANPDPNTIYAFLPFAVDYSPEQGEPTLDDIESLLPSIEADGQQEPGLVTTRTDGWLVAAVGNHRLKCCRVTNRPFLARYLRGPLTAVELIKIKLTENLFRRTMSREEIADCIRRYMKATGHTQEQAAEHLRLSAGYVSKILSVGKLPPALAHLAGDDRLCHDARRMVATMPTPDLQKQLADRLLGLAEASGVRVKREAAQRLRAERLGGRKASKKRVKFVVDGVKLDAAADVSAEQVRELGRKLIRIATTGAGQPVPFHLVLPELAKSA